MGSSKQVALVKPSRVPVRRKTPAFLNKLSEIVNDPKTDDLIKWSVAGDSFYVYDEKLLSTQVLPYWFKHENYTSFVRQLNTYGFRTVQHLQKGVLKSEPGSEYAHFVHPNFRRAQPDLLRDIHRNNNSIPDAEDETNERESAALPTANAQVLDIHTINTIQRHQATISAEQSELKRNNELLWQEMQAARARQQKQEDTINRIVKFLAGVFAGYGSPVHKEDVGGSPQSHVVVPLRQPRLMIEGGMMDSSVHEVESPGQSSSSFPSFPAV
ncbi:HSF-type DNA-binding-domain-containing protein [Mycena albidolilacea]|uniref:HSF-type DNA-binding-domain-containing protein n=1 Tax=Mycena albidolilacea TaxID=1033008 RepID=A0AAD7ETY4_9AGAR|nr:HSF-type DNA-binding-domain-containing protein [Mycena albidolilacea]